ncbi:MAG: TonB-dependent receptor [Acidobacteria bacterium]|nr:TonB-dependent receptor [Acidobacteriota bacterium]
MNGLLLSLFLLAAAAGQGSPVAGVVLDSTGAAVPDAAVRLEVSGVAVNDVRTSTDGRFMFPGDVARPARVVVTAAGFASQVVDLQENSADLRITLDPAPFFEAVNVTTSRTTIPRADPTVTVTVISSAELLNSAAVSIDDALKTVPGFTLFRRTSSRVSNPTSQGVSLRGVGGTSASRSLVLANGIPLNDAFGGWVYFDKIPQAAIDRIEVQRGGGSDLYGADAVGGVVQILTVRPGRPMGRSVFEVGNLGTGRASVFGGARTGGWVYSAAGEWFKTDGYIPVAVDQDPGIAGRGPVDVELNSEHRAALLSIGYQAANGWRVDGSGSVFDEDRQNATRASINATASRQFAVDVTGGVRGGLVAVRGFGGTQGYDQTFSAVNATRTSEALNRVQRVPTEASGFGGQWVQPMGRHALLVGGEMRSIEGTNIETPYNAQGVPLATVQSGGTQRLGSGFAQLTLNVSDRLTVVTGGQVSGWKTESSTTAYSRTQGSLNPRGSFAYRVGEGVTVRASAYGGFRAPTLNEFYRGFRVGSTQTNANEALLPERLTGGDAGVQISRGVVSTRITAFWNVLDDAITNVTVSSTPALITKLRANADKIRASGFEFEGEARLPRNLSLTLATGIVSSRFKGDTNLRDNRVPQIPEYNVGIGARYVDRGWTGSAQLRVTGPQFEDDLNVFTLRRATVLDVYGGRNLSRQIQVFAAVENLFDNEYDVGRTPILTTGLPRAARVGVQIAVP